MSEIKNEHIPKHVAIIMDGNRRWAREKKMPLSLGHYQGARKIEPIVEYAANIGVEFLTFWAFSTENWNREKTEVKTLMAVFRRMFKDSMMGRLKKQGVKIKTIGDLSTFPIDIQEQLETLKKETSLNSKITVNFALNYGGRDEIIRAIEKIRTSSKFKNQKFKLTPEEFNTYLDTRGQPDVDLLIRTGGDMRLSGFLLWQMEYAELYFTNVFWPAFTPDQFSLAIKDFANRKRRFGK